MRMLWLSACCTLVFGQVRDLNLAEGDLRAVIVSALMIVEQSSEDPRLAPLSFLRPLTEELGSGRMIVDRAVQLEQSTRGEVPEVIVRATPSQLAQFISTLYLRTHAHSAFSLMTFSNPIEHASFLAIVDALDGSFDLKLSTTDPSGIYQLLIVEHVPVASLCFDRRLDARWNDRRDFIDAESLAKYLPKKWVRFMSSEADAMERLKRLDKAIRKEIQPVVEPYAEDFWQLPLETLLSKTGDCEDFANLFQAIAETYGISTRVVVGYIKRNGDGKRAGHAWCEYEGVIFDPTVSDPGKHTYERELMYDSHHFFAVRSADNSHVVR
ncbi:MAG: transglutaminase domain-containing protein [Acidobacteria bacterium]|nr:transglutaminase domain-containing protein [Acidobacteriota bacterium]